MISDFLQFAQFAILGGIIVEGVIDAYTTQKGFDIGLVEKNPLAAWLQKKVGLALSTFLGLGVVIFGIGILSQFYPKVALYGSLGGLILEGANVIRQFYLLNKYKGKKLP